jgi:hypothetical protein
MELKHRQMNNNTMDCPNNSKKNSHHINLISQITSLYERVILDEIQVLENLRVKIKKSIRFRIVVIDAHIILSLWICFIMKMDPNMDSLISHNQYYQPQSTMSN